MSTVPWLLTPRRSVSTSSCASIAAASSVVPAAAKHSVAQRWSSAASTRGSLPLSFFGAMAVRRSV